ncbi:hypothetical protein [Microbacterium sp.]|uniref:hypothetical protein n=1 Tax=Microbacterium sp. TaxID=51671 RepID=UPI0025DE4ADE|nr:hypothetical protein [Microbacterium sp.]
MSTATAMTPAPVRKTAAPVEHPGRRLHAIPAPTRRRRPRLAYGIVAVAGAIAIAVAQMVLSIMTTQTSYQLSSLTSQQRQLTWQKQILTDEVAGLSSPQYLAANAAALGMVIDESPSYLRLSDGKLLGPSQAAAGTSSVDPLHRGAVPNSLIASTPLVTQPDATIDGVPTPTDPSTDATTPVPLTDGLPVPSTH